MLCVVCCMQIYLEETSEWCGLFFASFYILCVLIVLNCFMALILEAFDHVHTSTSTTTSTRHTERTTHSSVPPRGCGCGCVCINHMSLIHLSVPAHR